MMRDHRTDLDQSRQERHEFNKEAREHHPMSDAREELSQAGMLAAIRAFWTDPIVGRDEGKGAISAAIRAYLDAAGYSKRTPGGEADVERAAAAMWACDGYNPPWAEASKTEREVYMQWAVAALSTRPAGESADPLTPVERERVRQHQEYDQIATAVERRPPSDGPTLLSIVERLAPDPSARASQPSAGEVDRG